MKYNNFEKCCVDYWDDLISYEEMSRAFIELVESKYIFSEREIKYAITEEMFLIVSISHGDPLRWHRRATVTIRVLDRYFQVDYYEGLTEMQDNDYTSARFIEVTPRERTIKIVEYVPINS